MKVTKSGKILTIDGRAVVLDQRIEEMVILDDRVIVELHVNDFKAGDALVGRNVIAVDAGGKLLWRIPATGIVVGNSGAPEAYFGLELEEDGKTINVGSATGWTYEIDSETGELSNASFHR